MTLHRPLRSFAILVFLLSFFASAAQAQYVHTQGQQIVDEHGKPLILRGLPISNWFVLEGYFWRFGSINQYQFQDEWIFEDLLGPTHAHEFLAKWRDQYMTKADVDRLKAQGFNSIRVPIHTKYFKTNDDEGFRLLDRLIQWCKEDHIYVIIMLESGIGGTTGEASDDGPGYPWLFKDEGMQKFVDEEWQLIARHYKNDTTVIGYDLFNEPLLWPKYLPEFEKYVEPENRRITEAIRKVDTKHIVFLQPARGRFSEFGKPFDNNVVYTFHSYGNQPGLPFLQQYIDFREKWNVPIFFTEIYTESAPAWVIAHCQEAEKRNIGWMIWPSKKMDGGSSGVYLFKSPANWNKIVLFAHASRDDRDIEDKTALRPPQPEIDAMFAEILENMKDEHVMVHTEYLKGLPGITVQPTDSPDFK